MADLTFIEALPPFFEPQEGAAEGALRLRWSAEAISWGQGGPGERFAPWTIRWVRLSRSHARRERSWFERLLRNPEAPVPMLNVEVLGQDDVRLRLRAPCPAEQLEDLVELPLPDAHEVTLEALRGCVITAVALGGHACCALLGRPIEPATGDAARAGGDEDEDRRGEGATPFAPQTRVLEAHGGWWCEVAAGRFLMGAPPHEPGHFDDESLHEVTISRPFLLRQTPVTQGEWTALMGDNPSFYDGFDERPVEMISWFEAVAWCNALSEACGLEAAYEVLEPLEEGDLPEVRWRGLDHPGYRLPTEAEWEYAARAGSSAPLPSGALDVLDGRDPALGRWAWYRENSAEMTHPVGQKLPNRWGLFDLCGNVAEWVWDLHGPLTTTTARDPTGAAQGGCRVARGGSWLNYPRYCRIAYRFHVYPGQRHHSIGLRPARTLV